MGQRGAARWGAHAAPLTYAYTPPKRPLSSESSPAPEALLYSDLKHY